MKTNIYFYLNDKDDTTITNIININFNPFKVGDKVWFEVDKLLPVAIKKLSEEWEPDFVDYCIKRAEERHDKFYNFRFKIISSFNTLRERGNVDDDFTYNIEYKCKPCPKFYWKWEWSYIKYYIKKLFNFKTK